MTSTSCNGSNGTANRCVRVLTLVKQDTYQVGAGFSMQYGQRSFPVHKAENRHKNLITGNPHRIGQNLNLI